MESRISSATSTATSMLSDSQRGNPMEMVRNLYTIMEPQLCKSYRENVAYKAPDPTNVIEQQLALYPDYTFDRKRKLKAARIVIDAVAELQDRHRRATNRRKAAEAKRQNSKDRLAPKLDPIKGSRHNSPRGSRQGSPNPL